MISVSICLTIEKQTTSNPDMGFLAYYENSFDCSKETLFQAMLAIIAELKKDPELERAYLFALAKGEVISLYDSAFIGADSNITDDYLGLKEWVIQNQEKDPYHDELQAILRAMSRIAPELQEPFRKKGICPSSDFVVNDDFFSQPGYEAFYDVISRMNFSDTTTRTKVVFDPR